MLQHNLFEIQTASDQGVDGIPRISLLLANADSHFSEIERAAGWKGARLRSVPVLRPAQRRGGDGRVGDFQGICNPPDEITRGHVPDHRNQPDEPAAAAAAAGSHPAAVSLGVSGDRKRSERKP